MYDEIAPPVVFILPIPGIVNKPSRHHNAIRTAVTEGRRFVPLYLVEGGGGLTLR